MRKKTVVQEYHDHLIIIRDYQMYYLFNGHSNKYSRSPYSEYCHPVIRGELLHSPIKDIKNISITLRPDREIERLLNIDEPQDGEKSLPVGHIKKRKTDLQATLDISINGLILLNQHLLEGKLPYLALHAHKLRYGNGIITSYHFSTEYEPDDYID